jgi:hypothetical protein
MAAKLAVLHSLLALLVLIAAFMPWGTVNAVPTLSGSEFPFGKSPFGDMKICMTITGWNGSLSPGGLKLVNWLVVLAAGTVATFAWLKARSIWTAPTALSITIAAYGLVHIALAITVLVGSKDGSLGIGSCLTAIAFATMIMLQIRSARSAPA